MFDAVCIKCGRLTDDDSLVYCSEACEVADHAVLNNYHGNGIRPQHRSSSRSSGSSVFISPYLAPGPPGAYIPDIPPLVLPKKRTTSSSASSDVTSVFEYDDNDAAANVTGAVVDDDQAKSDNMFHLPLLGVSETNLDTPDFDSSNTSPSVSLNLARRTPISALPFNFVRRPAPSDNRALAPALHAHAPIHTRYQAKSHPSPRNLVLSATAVCPPDAPFSSSDNGNRNNNNNNNNNNSTPPTPTLAIKRNRNNRASLPAYFSQLTITAHSKPSPPTLAHINVHVDISSDRLATPKAATPRYRLRGKSDQFFGRMTDDFLISPPDFYAPLSRTHALPVPGSIRRPVGVSESPRRERGRSTSRTAFGLSSERWYKINEEVERRGRSRVVTPRRVLS